MPRQTALVGRRPDLLAFSTPLPRIAAAPPPAADVTPELGLQPRESAGLISSRVKRAKCGSHRGSRVATDVYDLSLRPSLVEGAMKLLD